jgi:hypothetical protein
MPSTNSLAAFRAPKAGGDHHAYETTGWGDVEYWADHMASLNIKLWWGPGRHGPGDNLFMVGSGRSEVEISAELEWVQISRRGAGNMASRAQSLGRCVDARLVGPAGDTSPALQSGGCFGDVAWLQRGHRPPDGLQRASNLPAGIESAGSIREGRSHMKLASVRVGKGNLRRRRRRRPRRSRQEVRGKK